MWYQTKKPQRCGVDNLVWSSIRSAFSNFLLLKYTLGTLSIAGQATMWLLNDIKPIRREYQDSIWKRADRFWNLGQPGRLKRK